MVLRRVSKWYTTVIIKVSPNSSRLVQAATSNNDNNSSSKVRVIVAHKIEAGLLLEAEVMTTIRGAAFIRVATMIDHRRSSNSNHGSQQCPALRSTRLCEWAKRPLCQQLNLRVLKLAVA